GRGGRAAAGGGRRRRAPGPRARSWPWSSPPPRRGPGAAPTSGLRWRKEPERAAPAALHPDRSEATVRPGGPGGQGRCLTPVGPLTERPAALFGPGHRLEEDVVTLDAVDPRGHLGDARLGHEELE